MTADQDPEALAADIVRRVGMLPRVAPPPLTRFKGYLKCVDAARLRADQRLVLSIAVPGFSERLIFRHELDMLRSFLYSGQSGESAGSTRLQRHSSRRYAGGDDLERGRYFTVAKNAAGADDGTLQAEMMSYQDAYWSGCVMIADSSCLHHSGFSRGLQEQLRAHERSLFVLFRHTADLPHRFWARPPDFGAHRHDPSSQDSTLVYGLPYEVTKQDIEGVLDLRERASQEWLVTLVKDHHLQLDCFGREGVTHEVGFYEVLRYLLSPRNGGGMVHDVIGAYLRRLRVSGLVFPSARADNMARYADGQLVDWAGWCFVDYRGAHIDEPVFSLEQEVYDMPMVEFLRSTDFEESTRGWRRSGVVRAGLSRVVHQTARLGAENEAARAFRKQDYQLYWKTCDRLSDPRIVNLLAYGLAKCGLNGSPEDISPRMWQYVLHEMLLNDGSLPKLQSTKGVHVPLGLRLIGNPIR